MRCPDCGVEKDPSMFPRDRSAKSGSKSYCKPCHNARTRATIKRLHGDTRHYHYRQKYGIGRDDFERMKAAQGGLCPICRRREATQVDHDHDTGKVRGILCLNCNAGIGALRDDPRLVYEAVDYLSPDIWEDLCH